MFSLNYLICLCLGYFVGMINPSYLIALNKGFDIRKKGSGNAGASNAYITMGKDVGILCILLDILKSYAIVKLTTYYFADAPYAFVLTASACILGHIFPIYMRFRGGKGLACIGGSLLAYSPIVFLVTLIGGAILAFSIDYICVLPISVSIILPILYGIEKQDVLGMFILMFVGVIIIWKHQENLKRIKNGSELRLSFLWNKDKEIERLSKVYKNDDKL